MEDIVLMTEEQQASFCIDCDSKAEWALKKIKEAEDEHDRLMALITDAQKELEQKEQALDKKLEQETGYLKHLLGQYMETVKCKETKTMKSYQLLSGKLVHKYGTTDYQKDDEALLEWTKHNRPGLVKIKASVDWATLKKELIVDEDGLVLTSDGEVVECIRAEKKPDSLDIKW